MGGENEPVKPGPRIAPEDVKPNTSAPLYDPDTVRTLFLEFEDADWEAELADFYNTDVEVQATLIADGVRYPNVGVGFRGASSFFTVSPGHKRSFNISMDYADADQRLYGHKTLNLLNSHGDPSYMSSVLYSHIARKHIPAPKANFAKVAINGELWGVYVNVEQFNKDFVAANFPASKGDGARWKVKGRPNADSGLRYTGDDVSEYKRRYTIKSKDDAADWNALINLCRVMDKTPVDELESALKPILDVDGVLWFLALDNALANSDGYWTRASDYSIFLDADGVFHIIPHDMNEAFSPNLMMPGGGGWSARGSRPAPEQGERRRPQPGNAYELDPLIGLDDPSKPLRSRLLQVPAFRAQYLANVRTIAEKDLNWANIGPFLAQQRALIEPALETDTRKDTSIASFRRATADTPPPPAQTPEAAPASDTPPRRPGGDRSLRTFADRRSAFLLKATAPANPSPTDAAKPTPQHDHP